MIVKLCCPPFSSSSSNWEHLEIGKKEQGVNPYGPENAAIIAEHCRAYAKYHAKSSGQICVLETTEGEYPSPPLIAVYWIDDNRLQWM